MTPLSSPGCKFAAKNALCCLNGERVKTGCTGGLFGVRQNLNLDMSGLDSDRSGVPIDHPAAGLPGLVCTVGLAERPEEGCNQARYS